MKSERDKFLTKVMGECHHQFDRDFRRSGVIWECIHCGDEYLTSQKSSANKGKNYSTWIGFGKLWKWANEQDWWEIFCENPVEGFYTSDIDVKLINPDRFADAIYNYLKDKE